MTQRPEHSGPPDLYYNDKEARKYTANNHIIDVQVQMSERAVELLALPDEQISVVLDIGCGSGLSGEAISESGHHWIGIDISESMLEVAQEREVEGDLLLGDIGQGLPFGSGVFDGAISISAIQWLCTASSKAQHPPKRLFRFFTSLYAALARGSRAVFQFYPENSAQIELITQQAMKAGFTGGLVVDFPNSTKAKKMYLVLFVGGSQPLPQALGVCDKSEQNQISFAERRNRAKMIRGKPPKKSKDWILDKKERARRQGKNVRPDTKYSGRKRNTHF